MGGCSQYQAQRQAAEQVIESGHGEGMLGGMVKDIENAFFLVGHGSYQSGSHAIYCTACGDSFLD